MALCRCGCGLDAGVWPKTYTKFGVKKGDPRQFINGHQWKKDQSKLYEVDPNTGCWNWIGNLDNGYARIGKRLAYMLFYVRAKGPKPTGLDLDHVCKNRACVNPDHLEPVTRAENVRRGRSTKLTIEDVAEIRRLFMAGATNVEIARRFNIGTTQASRIKRGESWKAA